MPRVSTSAKSLLEMQMMGDKTRQRGTGKNDEEQARRLKGHYKGDVDPDDEAMIATESNPPGLVAR